MLWANNGDIISRQYAGTVALKVSHGQAARAAAEPSALQGDFTRTGSRRLAGMMKDGYNSANRWGTHCVPPDCNAEPGPLADIT